MHFKVKKKHTLVDTDIQTRYNINYMQLLNNTMRLTKRQY